VLAIKEIFPVHPRIGVVVVVEVVEVVVVVVVVVELVVVVVLVVVGIWTLPNLTSAKAAVTTWAF